MRPRPRELKALTVAVVTKPFPFEMTARDGGSGDIRRQAAQALGEIGDASAPALLKAARDKDAAVAGAAIDALALLGSADAVKTLLALCDHAEPGIRARAIRALATYRNPQNISAARRAIARLEGENRQ
jgi:HEAT repeat protein